MMKNKVLVELIVPVLEENYDVYLPINKKIGNIIEHLNRALFDMTNGIYNFNNNHLYNTDGEEYKSNALLRETDIRNGSSVVLL